MRDVTMAIPAITVKRLGAHHNSFSSIFMAVDTIGLNDALGFIIRADRHRNSPRHKSESILRALPALLGIIHREVIVRQMASVHLAKFSCAP